MTISASGTDPYQTSVTPANGLRTIYLWMTCSSGAAALDAEVSTDLATLGFNPTEGILNLGDATHLLLALSDCPYGGTPLLLGEWIVMDDGGSFVLGSGVGPLVFVDCLTSTPSEEVYVLGLSTTSSAPPHLWGLHL